jgi:hypothetical protein
MLLSGSSSSSSSAAATKSSFSATVAEGEAYCSVPSDEELDELVEVEMDLSSS